LFAASLPVSIFGGTCELMLGSPHGVGVVLFGVNVLSEKSELMSAALTSRWSISALVS
jgi:hypothetical protein